MKADITLTSISKLPAGLRISPKQQLSIAIALVLVAILVIGIKGSAGSYTLDSIKLKPINDHVAGDEIHVTKTRPFNDRMFGRIVSMYTFVGEAQFFGSLSPRITKSINIVIHILCAAGLFALLFRLLKTTRYRQQAPYLAFFACSLWLLSPVNLGTAFYAIQRMAQLSTLFTIAGLLCYVHLRTAPPHPARRALLLAGYITALLLALGSKINGVNLLLLTALVEAFFFNFRGLYFRPRTWCGILISISVAATIAVFLARPEYFDYGVRDFNMYERMLTQFRVIPLYIRDLFLPLNQATGLYRHIEPSRGLLSPPSTFLGLLSLVGYVGAVLVTIRRGLHYIAFGLLFFAAGHTLESSIVPLELHFLHRNYLPSIGLYLALALGLQRIADTGRRTSLITACCAIYLAFFCATGYARAVTWSNPINLGAAAFQHNPDSYRATGRYVVLLTNAGKVRDAFNLLDAAIANRPDNDFPFRIQRLYYRCAIGKNVPDKTYNALAQAKTRVAYIEINSALHNLTTMLEENGCPSLNEQRLSEALANFAESKQKQELRRWAIHYYAVRVLRIAELDADANKRLQDLIERGYGNAGLMLADHYLRSGEQEKADEVITRIEKEFSLESIKEFGLLPKRDEFEPRRGAMRLGTGEGGDQNRQKDP